MKKRILSLLLCLTMAISLLQIGTTSVSAATTLTASQIQSYAESLVGNSYSAGYCLAFVADVFSSLGAKRDSACCAYTYGTSHISSSSMSNIPVGADVFFTGSGSTCSHCKNKCGHIGIYVGNGYMVHAMSGKVKKDLVTTINSYSNLSYRGWGYHGGITIKEDIPIPTFDKDSRYPTPISAYPAATSGKITVYNSSLTAYPQSTRYISFIDLCKIKAVYTNGYCEVTYPTSSGNHTEYAKTSDFIPNSVTPYSYTASYAIDTYIRSNLSEKFGSLSVNDKCTVVGKTGNKLQLIYPLNSGGYKLGWIDSSYEPPKPVDDPVRPAQINPDPVASGAFNGKTIVAMASHKITFATNRYISAGDIVKLYNVNPSTGYCTVDYPGGGSNDVFSASTVRTETVAINEFINYNGSAQAETAKIPEKLTAYPTSDMNQTVAGYTTNWYLSPNDTYTTINVINGATEVLYYCDEGKHAGCWKLGWVWLDYYYFDINGYLDNATSGDLGTYGTADVYINGTLRANDVNDFYKSYPRGSTYEVKDIRAYNAYQYNGVKSGSLSGTLKGTATTVLNFTKKAVTLSNIVVTTNPTKVEYLEGDSLNTSGLVVTAYYNDGTTKNVTSSCSFSGYTSTPGVKTVTATYSGMQTAFTVNVKSKSPTGITITSPPTKTTYYIGETINLSGLQVRATYDNNTTAMITEYDAYVDDDMTATAGSKTVSVTYVYNDKVVTSSFTITVLNVSVTGVTLNKTSTSLTIGNSETLTATIVPSNATNKTVTWKSSNTSIATVLNGVVTAKGVGDAIITVTTADGSHSASCSISVTSLSSKGDVNGDGEIDIADALLVMKHDAGLTAIDNAFKQAADVNNDGEIDIADAILIMKYDAGLINKF